MRRGEVWWVERMEDKRRPVLILTRNAAIDVLSSVVVVPATRTIRSIPSELLVGPDDGMPARSAFTFDNIYLVPKSSLRERICTLDATRMGEACHAMSTAFDC